jgi:uncharacterized protein
MSLKLMKTDHLDLWLLHNVGIPEEVNAVFAKGGTMEAFTQMRDQRVVRYLGVTAHYQPEPIIDIINRFPQRSRHPQPPPSFTQRLLPLALEKQMGIIGMKIASRGRILSSWTPPPVEEQQRSWEGVATRSGTLNIRDGTNFVLAPCKHRHHRLRQHRAGRRKRANRPRVHTPVAGPDGRHRR